MAVTTTDTLLLATDAASMRSIRYLAQKRHALDAWAGQIAGIVPGEEAHSNVVRLGL